MLYIHIYGDVISCYTHLFEIDILTLALSLYRINYNTLVVIYVKIVKIQYVSKHDLQSRYFHVIRKQQSLIS